MESAVRLSNNYRRRERVFGTWTSLIHRLTGIALGARARRRGDRISEGARQSWRDQPVQVRPRQGLASRLEASVA
jgi:hypothetical protein